MALFRKFFYKKPPDGLLEISERVYVFDCCFTMDILEEDEYKIYMGGIVTQLRGHFPDASFMVFNFREGENQSQICNILSEYDMIVMDYPRHYESCPILTMEMIHHFLRSSESWLSLGQQNVLLMNCERGGWPILAFMLASLLIYRKQYTGEQKTLDMIYKQAPRELLELMSPLNPLPSQFRYLQYVSRRNVGSEWPPLDRALTLDCIILRFIPSLEGHGGCRPIFRIYGQDPFMAADRTPKVLFSTPKRCKTVRQYKQTDCELVKIDIQCHIQGDVVLECISLHDDLEREEMMFRVMFNTAFIRSNILILNREEIDILWDANDLFPKDFRTEVLFSEMDAAASLIGLDLPSIEEKEGLPIEAFAKVQEIFSDVDWLDPNKDIDVAMNMLKQIAGTDILEKLEITSPQSSETSNILQEALEKVNERKNLEVPENNAPTLIKRRQSLQTFENDNLIQKKIDPHDLNVAFQPPAQLKVISRSNPVSYCNSLRGSPLPIARYHSAPSSLGITSLLQDHDASCDETVNHVVTKSRISPSTSPPPPPPHFLSADGKNDALSLIPSPPPPPPFLSGTSPSHTVKNNFLSPIPSPPPPPPSFLPTLSSPLPPPPPPPPFLGQHSLSSSIKKSSLAPPPPPLPFLATCSPSSVIKNACSAPPPPPPPPGLTPVVRNASSAPPLPPPPPGPPPPLRNSGPPPPPGLPPPLRSSGPPPPPGPPPLPTRSGSSLGSNVGSSAPPPPPPPFLKTSPHGPPVPPPPAPPKGLSKVGGPQQSHSSGSNVSAPPIPAPPFNAKGRIQPRAAPTRNPGQTKKANLKPYHWLKLTRAMQGSLWADTQKPDEASKAPEFDMSELESLFSAAAPVSDKGSGAKTNRSAGPKNDKVLLVELRRAYNCEIMLSKVKVPLPDLMSSVLALDDSALDIDQVENLIKFCPTKEEMELIKGYSGDKENLGKCEQFFLELLKVPRVESKLRVFSFKIQFRTQVSDLRKSLNIVNSASEEIRNSAKLKQIMQTILSLGNALNHGTARGSAIGFRLDSLLKLTDTRARNKKMTLMHYLCKVLAEKLSELLDFSKDLVSLEAATKIQLKYLAEEMQAISKGLEKVVQELTASENDGQVSEFFCRTLKEFLGSAEAEVRSLAFLYSGVGRNADALALYFGEDPARCPFEQVVTTLLNFVQMFVRAHDENCKQIEFEKKKAQKEAETEEKMKKGTPKKEAEPLTEFQKKMVLNRMKLDIPETEFKQQSPIQS